MQKYSVTIKSTVRRMLAPLARPVWRRVWARIESRIDRGIDNKLIQKGDELNMSDVAWHQHLPAIVNTAASVGAVAREQVRIKRELERHISLHDTAALAEFKTAIEQLEQAVMRMNQEQGNLWAAVSRVNQEQGSLWKRTEFVRSELLYEMRYGVGSKPMCSEANSTPARIIAADKVAGARLSGLKLNLGCGHVPLAGYINVDMRDLPGVDVVARVDALPFQPGEVNEIFSAHMLEHFTNEEFERKLLPYWIRLLTPGGTFRAVVPDAKAMIDAAAADGYPFEDFRKVLFGGQDYDGDFHYNMFTAESLGTALRAAGLVDIEVIAENRKNDIAFELEIAGRAPGKQR